MAQTKQILHVSRLPSNSTASKRFFLGTLLASAWAVSSCAAKQPAVDANLSPEDKLLAHKFRGLYGIVLRLDADPEKEFTSIVTDKGVRMSGAGRLALKQVGNQKATPTTHSYRFPKPFARRGVGMIQTIKFTRAKKENPGAAASSLATSPSL